MEEATQPCFAILILGNEQEITWVSSNNFSCVVSCARLVGKGLDSPMMGLWDCVADYYDGIMWLIIMMGLLGYVPHYYDGIVGLCG